MTTENVRVVLCDDQPAIRDVLRKVVGELPGFCVRSEAATGPELLELLRAESEDLVILDVTLPGGGPTLTALLRREHPLLTILVLSADDDPHLQQAVLEADADAFILKSGRLAPLRTALLDHARASLLQEWVTPDLVVREVLRESGGPFPGPTPESSATTSCG